MDTAPQNGLSNASRPQQRVADWWRSAVVYQVYPRSFADSNDDGTGDVGGLIDKLPYLAELGIDAVWMQLGGVDEAAAARAEAAGLTVVMDTCPKIEYPRLARAGGRLRG